MRSADVAAIPLDTHRFVKRLADVGMNERQAEALADEQVVVLNTNLATRSELAAIEGNLKQEIAALDVRTANVRADLLRWMIRALIAQSGVIVGLIRLLPLQSIFGLPVLAAKAGLGSLFRRLTALGVRVHRRAGRVPRAGPCRGCGCAVEHLEDEMHAGLRAAIERPVRHEIVDLPGVAGGEVKLGSVDDRHRPRVRFQRDVDLVDEWV